jgi:hypothetical protein
MGVMYDRIMAHENFNSEPRKINQVSRNNASLTYDSGYNYQNNQGEYDYPSQKNVCLPDIQYSYR